MGVSFEEAIKWVRNDIGKLETKTDAKFAALESKIDDLSQFKWKVLGGTWVVHAIVGLVVQIGIAYFIGR